MAVGQVELVYFNTFLESLESVLTMRKPQKIQTVKLQRDALVNMLKFKFFNWSTDKLSSSE